MYNVKIDHESMETLVAESIFDNVVMLFNIITKKLAENLEDIKNGEELSAVTLEDLASEIKFFGALKEAFKWYTVPSEISRVDQYTIIIPSEVVRQLTNIDV